MRIGKLVGVDDLQMALACRDYLKENGVETYISRETDCDSSLRKKINEANALKVDFAIDIHNNAGGGNGFEVFHSVVGGKGKEFAQNIEKEVIKIGQNSRGLKTKKGNNGKDYFGFIRDTNCPAVITEGVFVDNEYDYIMADTTAKCSLFGIAYAKGIKTWVLSEKSTLIKSVVFKDNSILFYNKPNATADIFLQQVHSMS